MIETIWNMALWLYFPLAIAAGAGAGVMLGKIITGEHGVPHVPVIAPAWFFIKRRILTPVLTRLGAY